MTTNPLTLDALSSCTLCPRRCRVDRTRGHGYCGAGARARIALVSLHPWEEPCLTGGADGKGAGTVFFSYCNLRCCYCQNHEISHGGKGEEVTEERLAEIFLEQQARGAATLDLVTPTHYVPQILAALRIARARGLTLPVVYNSSAYETEETIAMLAGEVAVNGNPYSLNVAAYWLYANLETLPFISGKTHGNAILRNTPARERTILVARRPNLLHRRRNADGKGIPGVKRRRCGQKREREKRQSAHDKCLLLPDLENDARAKALVICG